VSNTKISRIGLALIMTLLLMASSAGFPYAYAATDPPLGSTSTFGILAGAGFTAASAWTVTGNAGSSPTATCTGFSSPCTGNLGATVTGTIYLDTGVGTAGSAQTDLTTAYGSAAGQGPGTVIGTADMGIYAGAGSCGAGCFTPGVYSSGSTLLIATPITLSGSGVYIFIASSSLTASASVSVTGGASAAHVYWVTGSPSGSGSATIGSGTTFLGTILAKTSITFAGGNTFTGRALAEVGSVSLSGAAGSITNPGGAGASVPEFPVGILLLAVPVLAIYLFMRGRAGSLGARIRLSDTWIQPAA